MNTLLASPLAAVVVTNSTSSLLVNLLILAVVLVVAFWIVDKMAAPNPIGTLLRIVVGVLGLIWLLNLLGAIGNHGFVIYHG